MDEIARLFAQLDAPGVVAIVAWMVISDKLISRRRYDEMRADRDGYRDAWEKSNEALLIQARTTIERLEIDRRTDHFISSIPGLAGREADDVEPNA